MVSVSLRGRLVQIQLLHYTRHRHWTHRAAGSVVDRACIGAARTTTAPRQRRSDRLSHRRDARRLPAQRQESNHRLRPSRPSQPNRDNGIVRNLLRSPSTCQLVVCLRTDSTEILHALCDFLNQKLLLLLPLLLLLLLLLLLMMMMMMMMMMMIMISVFV